MRPSSPGTARTFKGTSGKQRRAGSPWRPRPDAGGVKEFYRLELPDPPGARAAATAGPVFRKTSGRTSWKRARTVVLARHEGSRSRRSGLPPLRRESDLPVRAPRTGAARSCGRTTWSSVRGSGSCAGKGFGRSPSAGRTCTMRDCGSSSSLGGQWKEPCNTSSTTWRRRRTCPPRTTVRRFHGRA